MSCKENDIIMENAREMKDEVTPFDLVGGQMDTIIKGLKPLVFDSEEEAKEYFDEHTICQSDDVDKEEARFEHWFNDNEVRIN